jgi:hypothetical protein
MWSGAHVSGLLGGRIRRNWIHSDSDLAVRRELCKHGKRQQGVSPDSSRFILQHGPGIQQAQEVARPGPGSSVAEQPSARGVQRGPESSEVGRPEDHAISCGDIHQIEVDPSPSDLARQVC